MKTCHCGREALPNRKQCKNCTNNKNNINKSLREQGLCIVCRTPSPKSFRCSKCSLKNSLRRSKVNATVDELLQLLEDQGNRCAYTGLTIQAGVNAHLDHKQPKSKGGSDELQNLHWIESNINKLKGNMLHDEFIDYLRHLKDALDTLE